MYGNGAYIYYLVPFRYTKSDRDVVRSKLPFDDKLFFIDDVSRQREMEIYHKFESLKSQREEEGGCFYSR